jgi:hypothetical protein
MSFTMQRMLGNQAVVSGTDINGQDGSTTVSTTQWDELNGRTGFSKAQDEFDAAVEEFFKPLTDAAEKVTAAMAGKTSDPVEFVVVNEAVEGVAAKPATIVGLSKDSIIIRLIEEGDTDRLVWTSPNTLGVLAKS